MSVGQVLDHFPREKTELSIVSCGRTAAWLAFLATSLQLAFLQPYVVLISGERANLFSGLLCFVSLLLALVFCSRGVLSRRSPEVWFSLVLLLIVIVSSALSSTPASSSARGFVIMAAALGGFWCSRLLLNTDARKIFFQRFCFAILGAVLLLAGLGLVHSGGIHEFMDVHWHPVVGRIYLLSFSALTLAFSTSLFKRWLGGVALLVSYAILLLSTKHTGAETAVMIPAALCLIVACSRVWRLWRFSGLLLMIFLMSVTIGRCLVLHAGNLAKNHESVAYRVENIFFSWHIAKENPIFGIGLWAPRSEYLDGYETRYPHVPKKTFAKWVEKLRTSESMFLTFLADLGFPFVILYGTAIAFLVLRLMRMTLGQNADPIFPPLAIALPLIGSLLHFLIFDALFRPQISWFFHILLALVPQSTQSLRVENRSPRGFILQTVLSVAVLVIGIILGLTISGIPVLDDAF